MPRSRSRDRGHRRKGHGGEQRPTATVLAHLLDAVNDDDMLRDAFDRAAWSFFGGSAPLYLEPDGAAAHRAQLRAREWFLFDFTLPTGLTAAEEWVAEEADRPHTAGLRRAVERLLDSECGLFRVEEVHPDGSLGLATLFGHRRVVVEPLERGESLLPEGGARIGAFEKGDLIGGRLYWLEDGRGELSPGADRIPEAGREELLANLPSALEADEAGLDDGLSVEVAFGANPHNLLALACRDDFPWHVDDLLSALSDGTFGYRRLWRELEGEADPVGVTRQMLTDLDAWTTVEPELLACAVAGAWWRRRGTASGSISDPTRLSKDSPRLADFAQAALDSTEPAQVPHARRPERLSLSPDDSRRLADLDVTDDVEWVVDVCSLASMPAPRETPRSSALSCIIVEDLVPDADSFDDDEIDLRDLDEEDLPDVDDEDVEDNAVESTVREPGSFGAFDEVEEDLEDEELNEGAGDEPGWPRVLMVRPVGDEDETAATLTTLVRALVHEDATGRRPSRIVFRRRRLAAQLRDTLEDAGIPVGLDYFTTAVDEVLIDLITDEAQAQAEQTPAAESGADRAACDRLAKAAGRCHKPFEELLDATDDEWAAFALTLDAGTPLPYTHMEGEEEEVTFLGAVLSFMDGVLRLDILFNAADLHAADRVLSGGESEAPSELDHISIEFHEAREGDDHAWAGSTGLTCREGDLEVAAFRHRPDYRGRLIAGDEMLVAAGVMEALAALLTGDERPEWGADTPMSVRVQSLGSVSLRAVRS